MPAWLQILLGLMGAGGVLFTMIRFENNRQTRLLKAELAVSLLEHTTECPARGRAVQEADDSGAAPHARAWSPSGRLVQP